MRNRGEERRCELIGVEHVALLRLSGLFGLQPGVLRIEVKGSKEFGLRIPEGNTVPSPIDCAHVEVIASFASTLEE